MKYRTIAVAVSISYTILLCSLLFSIKIEVDHGF